MLRLRARAQRLTAESATHSTPRDVLADVRGLQAQVLEAAYLGIRARCAAAEVAALERARIEERSIVRTWLMRGTLHLVSTEDLRWLLDLLGPPMTRTSSARHAQLGLDEDLKAKGMRALRQILEVHGPMTRYELVERLRRRRIQLDPKTQAPIHLIQWAALKGVLCLGPERARGEPTYVLIDDWIGPSMEKRLREATLGDLARGYIAGYGPASIEDLASWSGIPTPLARTAMAEAQASLVEVTVRGRPAWILKGHAARLREPDSGPPTVKLLANFDTYLLGYRSRDLAVPAALQRRLQRGGGWLHPAIVVDGRAVAAWTLHRRSGRGRVVIEPFEKLGRAVRAGINAEVADIGRFLSIKLDTEIAV